MVSKFVRRRTFVVTAALVVLGAVVADTMEDAWRQARARWPNLDIDVELVPPQSSAPNSGTGENQ